MQVWVKATPHGYSWDTGSFPPCTRGRLLENTFQRNRFPLGSPTDLRIGSLVVESLLAPR